MDVSYRQIAKRLAQGMPVEGQDYSDIIEGYIRSIEAMPVEQQAALKASFIFSSMAPKDERQDLFQALVEQCLTELAKFDGQIKDPEAYCYTVARHRRWDFWKQSKRRTKILNGGFISLEEPVQNGDGQEVELKELIADDLDLESEINSQLDCQAVLDTMPDEFSAIVVKRLDYKKQNRDSKLSSSEVNKLWRYVNQNGDKIREAIRA